MAKTIPFVKHNDGTKIPGFGLGTYLSLHGEGKQAIKDAIDAGYRHFDTAFFYENEAEVGEAIREKIAEGVIKREDVYIVTKLWCHFHEPQKVEHACRLSLKNFGLDYIDVYLMHWPFGYVYRGDQTLTPTDANGEVELNDIDYVDTYKAMEKLVDLGLAKSIGVSNFNIEQLKRVLSNCKIKPVHNQIEANPGLIQTDLIKFCKESNIIVTAYRPLGNPDPAKKTPNFLFDDKVTAIAAKYKKTTAQIVLRYLIDIGVVPIPKSVNPERMKQNMNVYDFKLNSADVTTLASYNTGLRLICADYAVKSKYYPF